MATLTADKLVSILTTPVGTTLPSAPDPFLTSLAHGIVRADEVGNLATLVTILNQHSPQPTPAPIAPVIADRKARKSQDTSDFWNGPATAGQIRRNTNYATKHGFSITDMTGWTAAMARDDLKSMQADVAADNYPA